MRLHAYSSYPRERYGTYIAPLGDDSVVRFTMTPGGTDAVLDPHAPAPSPDPATREGSRMGGGEDGAPVATDPTVQPVEVHRTESGLAYMTLWSDGRRVSLTWLCRDEDFTVHLAGPGVGEVVGPASVAVRATGSVDGPVDEVWRAGEWEHEPSPTPAFHGASDAASRMLGLAADHAVLEIEVRSGAVSAGSWRILMGDLERAVRDFPCR